MLVYFLIWQMGLALLLIMPHRFSEKDTTIFILISGVLCRLALLAHPNFSSALSFKLPGMIFDLTALCLVLILLSDRGLDLRWSILYAFNPVVLCSFSGSGYADSISISFLLAALCCYHREKWILMFLLIGIAILSLPVTIITLPFLVRRENLKFVWISLVPVLALSLVLFHGNRILSFIEAKQRTHRPKLVEERQSPFLTELQGKLTRLNFDLRTTEAILQGFQFKGSLYKNAHRSPVYLSCLKTLGSFSPAVLGLGLSLCAILLFGYLHLHPQKNLYHLNDPVSGCFFVLGAWIILFPEVRYWQLTWIVPFLALRPAFSWMLLCLSFGVYFTAVGGSSIEAGRWILPLWLQAVIWGPFYGKLLHEIRLAKARAKAPAGDIPPQAVSVVIPTLNESDFISRCIRSVLKDPAVTEVIVVDGGSTDGTNRIAKRCGARVIDYHTNHQPGTGRGGQINAGIKAATKDVVAIVHADTRITYPTFKKILDLLRNQPMIVGGAVGSVFDQCGLSFRLLEIANDFRAVCMGVSFGDQVQFFRRKPVLEARLFPPIALMEDVEFAIRLHRLGRQTYLFGDAVVSARKWKERGFGHAFTVVKLLFAYLWQRLWKTPDTQKMYRQYYRKTTSSK